MLTGLAIFSVVLGVMAAVLIPFAGLIARRLWPGPTVKGPGDVYAQAFQAILCVLVLGSLAVLASGIGWIAATRASWSIGRWMSAAPVLAMMMSLFAATLSARRRRSE